MRTSKGEDSRIMLGLLEAVQADGSRTQRHLATELGIAVGLVNSFLKRCISKGLVKVSQAPARRYAYYLTPEGFAEKSRLTVEFLTDSFAFFRQARSECAAALREAKACGWRRIALAGASEVAEVMLLCAIEVELEVVAIIDPVQAGGRLAGCAIVASLADLSTPFDGIVVTALDPRGALAERLPEGVDRGRIIVPHMLAAAAKEGWRNV